MGWRFWRNAEDKAQPADNMPEMRNDGFLLLDVPTAGQQARKPDYLADVGDQESQVRQLSSYAEVDHSALARTNAERTRPRSFFEKLRSGESLSSEDIPMQGAVGGVVLRVLNWTIEPFVLFFSNLGIVASVTMVILILMVITFFLGEWSQWMFRDLY